MQGYPPQPPYGPDYSVNMRPITKAEVDLVVKLVNNMRGAIIGVSVISMVLALVTLVYYHQVICIFTGVMAIMSIACVGVSVRNRKLLPKISDSINKGMVMDVYGVAAKQSRGKFSLGPINWQNNSELAVLVTVGQPVTLGCLPNTNLVVSVNGLPLKRWGWVKGMDQLQQPTSPPPPPTSPPQAPPPPQQARQF